MSSDRGWGIVDVPKSKKRASTEADRVGALARALADYLGRKVVVVSIDDKEVVVEPHAKPRLDS